MEKYYIIFLTLGLLFVDPSYQQSSCEDDVNVCTVSFTLAQQTQASSGFNLTAICSIVDEFMTCVNTALAPCDVITRNTLMSAIDQLIEIYTNAPYGCNLDFAETFEYGNCSQEVTKCAFFKYDAEEQKDNATQACKEFDNFLQCMRENTTACKGAEQVEITQSIQNTTITFSKCPYACNMPDLICTTVSSTTTVTIETIYVSASPSLSSIAVSDIDLSEYYMVTLAPSEVFYDPSDVMSMYSGDVTDFYTPGISEDVIADETDLYESETYSDIQPTSTDAQTTPSSVDTTTTPETSTSLITTTTPKPATPTTELQSTSRTTPTTTTTSKPSTTDTTKTTNSVQENSTPLQKDSTTDTMTDTSAKDTSSASTEKQTTATPTTTTKKPTTTKTPVKTSRATARVTRKTTTDFPTPNYDNAGEINHQSAVIVLASLIFAFMS